MKLGFMAVMICGVLNTSWISGRAATPVSLENPTSFFTNVASRLLRSQLNLDPHNIQVYPTNQYSASVHRLLQVAANIYDAATNRTYGVPGATNGFPTIFRPLFRRIQDGTNAVIIIAEYREVIGTGMAGGATAPQMIELGSANLNVVPLLGAPFRSDGLEVMISGIPLIIGVKKGYPAFNEFSMQTFFYVLRALEFRRAEPFGPVVMTNQMYMVAVSNIFGIEAWNSYSNSYPRNLQLLATTRMTAVMTNEYEEVVLSNRLAYSTMTNCAAGTWQGWIVPNFASSFVLPWGSGQQFMFLTNSTYINRAPWFIPETPVFDMSNADNYYVPHWSFVPRTSVLFALVDTEANRIVDYLNLDSCDKALDINTLLVQGATCILGSDLTNPANQWCTNRWHGSIDPHDPTIGILNQMAAGLGLISPGPNFEYFQLDPNVGQDVIKAIGSFRYNLIGDSTPGQTFYRSNVFYAPLRPYRSICINTIWQANDPLVHYTIDDLLDWSMALTNRVTYYPNNPPLGDLGFVNRRYNPWGGNPYRAPADLPFQIAVKDPMVIRPDDWNFPCNPGLNPTSLGGVHRGTPWQTLFLKSTNILELPGPGQGLFTWEKWTGNFAVRPNWKGNGGLIADALVTAPTNDWTLVSLLTTLFNTNNLSALASVNQASVDGWAGLLDGIMVLTNPPGGGFDQFLMSSNSPQAAEIALGLNTVREREPNRVFTSLGDILATPQLSDSSPWLDFTNRTVSDAALELIPSQLLPRLRADSIGSILLINGLAQIQFTGVDDYAYAVQESTNLEDWSSVLTYRPTNGMFSLRPMPSTNSVQTFYRSVLMQ